MSTKEKLVRQVAELGLTKKRSSEIVGYILDRIGGTLSRGETVQIENFGKFEVSVHSSRVMENPETGETHEIPERRVVNFKPSDNFTDRFNEASS